MTWLVEPCEARNTVFNENFSSNLIWKLVRHEESGWRQDIMKGTRALCTQFSHFYSIRCEKQYSESQLRSGLHRGCISCDGGWHSPSVHTSSKSYPRISVALSNSAFAEAQSAQSSCTSEES